MFVHPFGDLLIEAGSEIQVGSDAIVLMEARTCISSLQYSSSDICCIRMSIVPEGAYKIQ